MDIFNRFISSFDIDIPKENILYVGKNYFYASKELKETREKIKRDIYSAGIYLGEEKNDFIPSPALIEMISKMPGSEHRKIFVNDKAEWLFVCGRNILESSITKNPSNIRQGLVFVQNSSDENLGYGIFDQQGKDLIVKNLLDKGKYLRYNERRKKHSSRM